MMDKIVPLLLLALGTGALYLGTAGLVRLGRDRSECWLFGLGVRSRVGAIKVLVVAAALFFLSYSSYKSGSLTRMLQSSVTADQEIYLNLTHKLNKAEETLTSYRNQIGALNQERIDCQNMVSRLGAGLANKNDIAGELKSILAIRKKEITGFESSLGKMRGDLNQLQQEYDQLSQLYRQSQDRSEKLESQLRSLQSERSTLEAKFAQVSSQNEVELRRMREENGKLRGLNRDVERRSNLLRQGLSLREANDWQLEQAVQRLANLLARQPDVNTPTQSEISRAIQQIHQTLREGAALTKNAKTAEAASLQQSQGKASDLPEK
jgi:chromosome segregation ATPase